MSDDLYKIDAICSNCGFDGNIEIPKGIIIDDFGCPNCGCLKLQRDFNAHLRNRSNEVNYR